MQMMIEDKNAAINKKWFRKEVMKAFTPDQLRKMAAQKEKEEAKDKTRRGIACGLPEGYDTDF